MTNIFKHTLALNRTYTIVYQWYGWRYYGGSLDNINYVIKCYKTCTTLALNVSSKIIVSQIDLGLWQTKQIGNQELVDSRGFLPKQWIMPKIVFCIIQNIIYNDMLYTFCVLNMVTRYMNLIAQIRRHPYLPNGRIGDTIKHILEAH